MEAASYGHKKICELLIAHGADVNKNSFLGSTALMYAALDEDNKEICELLIDAMMKLTPQERSQVSALLSLKKRNIPGLTPDTKKLIALAKLADIKREKRQKAREQIEKIDNEEMKQELLRYLENIK